MPELVPAGIGEPTDRYNNSDYTTAPRAPPTPR